MDKKLKWGTEKVRSLYALPRGMHPTLFPYLFFLVRASASCRNSSSRKRKQQRSSSFVLLAVSCFPSRKKKTRILVLSNIIRIMKQCLKFLDLTVSKRFCKVDAPRALSQISGHPSSSTIPRSHKVIGVSLHQKMGQNFYHLSESPRTHLFHVIFFLGITQGFTICI